MENAYGAAGGAIASRQTWGEIMIAKLSGAAAAMFIGGALLSADKVFAMARPVASTPEFDGSAGIAAMALLASIVAVLSRRNKT
jgi:hypothetical protein